jgi:hypothetical protein
MSKTDSRPLLQGIIELLDNANGREKVKHNNNRSIDLFNIIPFS